MKQVKDVIVMVIDNGFFSETALRLARDCKKVYYCYPGWIDAGPIMNESNIGKGIPGFEVVDSFWPYLDEVDLWVFPHLYYGDMQVELEKMGKAVWGSRKGEDLELYRDEMKRILKGLGLPVNPWRMVKGMDNLRKHLEVNPGKWVKINKYRGYCETFHCIDIREIESILVDLEHQLGPFKGIPEFLIDNELPDCVEIGEDCYTIDGKFPKRHMAGIEVKNKSYVAVIEERKNLPEGITQFSNALSGTFKKIGYRGPFSTECRIDKKKVSNLVDFTARQGAPPSELYMEMYKNFSEIAWAGANGIVVDPDPIAKFGVEIMLMSDWAIENFQEVIFPEKYRQNIKFKYPCIINNRYYSIPQDEKWNDVGCVVAWGDTLDKAIEEAKKIAKEIKGHGIEAQDDSLDDAQEAIDKLEEFGVNYFGKGKKNGDSSKDD